MKSFSAAGMTCKGFYGRGARTFGNPDGALTGGGAYAAGGLNPNGPNQGGGSGSGPSTINLLILNDHIDSVGTGVALLLSDMLTPQQQDDWNNGVITTCNIRAGGNPPRGYWIIAGCAGTAHPVVGDPGGIGFQVDMFSPSIVTINLNTTQLRIYGGGGAGGGGSTLFLGQGGNGGAAIDLNDQNIDLLISNTDGVNTGRIYGAGGGAGAGSGNFGNPNFPCGGGGGAGGWFPGEGGPATGGTAHAPGNPGGIYDPDNGGSSDPDVPGGDGGQLSGTGGGTGGGLGATATGGAGGPGQGGNAVSRSGFGSGSTFILNGGGSNFIRGTVQ